MSYDAATSFSGGLNPAEQAILGAAQSRSNYFHGQALARDPWAEHFGGWIVLGFTMAFSLFLVGMVLAGQTPGESFFLKSASDILQFVGEMVGLIFCVRIVVRLRRVARQLRIEVTNRVRGHAAPHEITKAHTEAQAAQRAFLAWLFLAIGIGLYASGQFVWSSYDVRMPTAEVPFPGYYDIGFVASYPFFLIGTLLLTRRNKASVGRARLVLDALAFIGASLALSWFFLLGPSIASLSQAPSAGAAFLSIYFPTGDLFLVAVGAFLMFSPLAGRGQQVIFLLLCLGLFFLAITDSLLGYYSLSMSFNTGTLQDVLWPLSMALIGLAAVEYPRSIAREQEQNEQAQNAALALATMKPSHSSQFTTTAQTITPFILVLMTCTTLLTVIAPRGGETLIQADVIALALILIVVVRQALTLIENNRLTMQMRGELVISRRELQVSRREADEAGRAAQEKQVLEDGVAALRTIHARVARGDFSARAPTIPGPLLPIAVSLNLMLDRLSSLSQRGARYDLLMHEFKLIQDAVDRLGHGQPAWPANQPTPQRATELRSISLGLSHLQRLQENQWRRVKSTLESLHSLAQRLRDSLHELRHSSLFKDDGKASFERMVIERVAREADLLEEQQGNLLHQALQANRSYDAAHITHTPAPAQDAPSFGQGYNPWNDPHMVEHSHNGAFASGQS
jgi:hypothetical protein